MTKSRIVFYKIILESKAEMMVRLIPRERIDILATTNYMEPVIEEVKKILSKEHEDKEININGMEVISEDRMEDRRKNHEKAYRLIDLDEREVWL